MATDRQSPEIPLPVRMADAKEFIAYSKILIEQSSRLIEQTRRSLGILGVYERKAR